MPRHLEIPFDLLDTVADVWIVDPIVISPVVADPTAAAAALRNAERPGNIVGGGARGAAQELAQLTSRLAAPVVSTANGKGIVPEDHVYSLGAGLHHPSVAEFVADCDVVLAVDTELASRVRWDATVSWRLTT